MYGWHCLTAVIVGLTPAIAIAELPYDLNERYDARDSLSVGDETSADARACLDGLVWKPEAFQVRCELPIERRGNVLVRFPSPIPSGDSTNDLVAMEWYVARDEQQQPITAPAVVVVHESGSGMTVGRLIAQGLRVQGLHAFMIQLPGYGQRRPEMGRSRVENIMTTIRQAVADVRRAHDAVAALPLVDTGHIALQGTSLGGFVAATSAGLDRQYDSVFLLLAGGDLYDLIQKGDRDAAKIRDELTKAGITGDQLRTLTNQIEPTRLAHRLNPERTWLYSGKYDTVVPPRNSQVLAEAAKLDQNHHIEMLADHYSGIIQLPLVLTQIHQRIIDARQQDSEGSTTAP